VARYSAFSLLRHGLSRAPWPRAWREHDLRRSYDVVIIGGGVHGLATAYYLAANHGIRNVAVLDRGYLGGGGSGRNTAILRPLLRRGHDGHHGARVAGPRGAPGAVQG
jgi:sarcosine oxidase, subunit beta